MYDKLPWCLWTAVLDTSTAVCFHMHLTCGLGEQLGVRRQKQRNPDWFYSCQFVAQV